jgi:putative FmdB family regulatory protein
MPTYEYACKDCKEHVEVVQSFKDEPLTICPSCGGPLRKVFGSIGISFKGSGFYKTDSRKSESASSSSAPAEKSDKKATPEKSDKAAASSTSTPASSSSSSTDTNKKAAS